VVEIVDDSVLISRVQRRGDGDEGGSERFAYFTCG
jgi:hypothetical protein